MQSLRLVYLYVSEERWHLASYSIQVTTLDYTKDFPAKRYEFPWVLHERLKQPVSSSVGVVLGHFPGLYKLDSNYGALNGEKNGITG